jgi:hypothetical protein
MTPEDKARENIVAMLFAAGWVVQAKDTINLTAARGAAICELSFQRGGSGKAFQLFETGLNGILDELNLRLVG